MELFLAIIFTFGFVIVGGFIIYLILKLIDTIRTHLLRVRISKVQNKLDKTVKDIEEKNNGKKSIL